MNIKKLISYYLNIALTEININCYSNLIQVQQTAIKKFGDYQINGLITISKKLNISTEKLIKKILKFLYFDHMVKTINFKEPGFINIFLHPKWIENQINYIFYSSRFNITTITPKTIIVDYSGPNIAKEMHVGHLRSTVIGDSIVRILLFLGHKVIRANHIGDWGTQFGMLIAYIQKNIPPKYLFQKITQITEIETLYTKAQEQYNIDPNFAELARNCVVQLQKNNIYHHKIWQHLIDISTSNNQKIYTRLNITLKKSDIMGESAYHSLLPNIVQDLKNKKLAVVSEGAIVVFIQNKNNLKNNQPFGVIIQKKDGAYLYSTTDIACIKYRCETLKANRIIYYTDSRQKQHLSHVWEISKKSGYIKQSTLLEHHMCGMLLEKNGKPFKTRSGNSLKLKTLLDEAYKHTHSLVLSRKSNNYKHNKIQKLIHTISIGAIKYSELSKNRTTNYIFDWKNILNFEGNTALYIQYAYTRIISVIKHSQYTYFQIKYKKIQLYTPEEISLAICLLQFEETLIITSNQGTPHILCAYLYKLSTLFSCFYENCPILKINNTLIQYSRIKLSILTARILKKGLNLLGIQTVEHI